MEGEDSVLSLELPAGSYLILAKAQAEISDYAEGRYWLTCRLYAGGDYDTFRGLSEQSHSLTMMVLGSSPQPFKADLACIAAQGATTQLRYLKLQAIPVRDLFNTPSRGAAPSCFGRKRRRSRGYSLWRSRRRSAGSGNF